MTIRSEIINLVGSEDLHMSTGDRLRLVADIIEAHPDLHDPGVWVSGGSANAHPKEAVELNYCGTPACIAGWAVMCSPLDEVEFRRGVGEREWLSSNGSWVDVGRQQLGLDLNLAELLFDGEATEGNHPARLRGLADLPEPRTYEAAEKAGLLKGIFLE